MFYVFFGNSFHRINTNKVFKKLNINFVFNFAHYYLCDFVIQQLIKCVVKDLSFQKIMLTSVVQINRVAQRTSVVKKIE